MQATGHRAPTRPAYGTTDNGDSTSEVPGLASLPYDNSKQHSQKAQGNEQAKYSDQLREEPERTMSANTDTHFASSYTTNAKYYEDQEKARNGVANGNPLASKVQFTGAASDEKAVLRPVRRPTGPPPVSPGARNPTLKAWVPTSLQAWFWIPLVIFLIGAGIALEVALHLSNKNKGWPAGPDDDDSPAAIARHYAYTLPPVIIISIVVAMWTWTDADVKKLQPYVDLVHGDSPADKSLLLDYSRDSNFLVWLRASSNRHYLVACGSLMVILTMSFQPLAAAILVVKDTWFTDPAIPLGNLAALSLNQNQEFSDLSTFLSGAGFAGATVMYHLDPPPFVRVPYTIAQFQLPVDIINNGTAFANTTAIKTDTGCVEVPVQMTQSGVGQWSNTATANGCSITWQVSNSTGSILFGTDIPKCANAQPQQFSPVIFWFFTYQPSAAASATFCSPTISFWDVNVGVDISTGNVTAVTEIRPFTATTLSANITGAPLNGRAYNGIAFDLQNPDQFVLARQAAIRLQLPASMFQAARQSTQGFANVIVAGGFTNITTSVYAIYLALVAKDVYFLPVSESITVVNKTFRKRVWLSDIAVHLLTVAMLVLAIFATIIHVLHRADRRDLRLMHEPGTIASAVSIGAQTGVADVLAGRQDENDFKEALAHKTFRMDPDRNVLVMSGEQGYDVPMSPGAPGLRGRRESVLDALRGRRSRQFTSDGPLSPSMYASSPKSPHTPKSSAESRTPPKTPIEAPSHV